MPRYKLRTLLIVLTLGPMVLAAVLSQGPAIIRDYRDLKGGGGWRCLGSKFSNFRPHPIADFLAKLTP
jgi:hypothetical protein